MKLTKDEALKKVKKYVAWYYKNLLGKPFIRKTYDNSHLKAFKDKRVIIDTTINLEKLYGARFLVKKS